MKLHIYDYESSSGLSGILFGLCVSGTSFLIMLSHNFLWIVAMVLGLSCIGSGIYKTITSRRKLEELKEIKRLGKRLTGKIVLVGEGSNKRKSGINTPVIAECVATDPDTGAENRYYSRRIFLGGGENIGGMLVDIYTCPSGQYYVDLESVRHESNENGKKVHDFR